jgi:hypothetical protein
LTSTRATSQDDAEAPWPVRRGGWVYRLYEHSLGLAFIGHVRPLVVRPRARRFAEFCRGRPSCTGDSQPTLGDYVTSARFWFESFQNWQVRVPRDRRSMVWLAVYLRQRYYCRNRKPFTNRHKRRTHQETGAGSVDDMR